VIDALEYHFRDTPDIIIWFDMFSINQHKAINFDFDWLCNTFKSAIKDFGHTVMVFAPWKDPVPLTRGWCLFELYCTITTNAKFEVAMSKGHREDFLEDICNTALDAINIMFATINTEKSQCFKQEDKDKIFAIVKRELGFGKVSALVFEKMRDWIIETTALALEVETDIVMKMRLMNGLAEVYRQQGIYDKAQPLYEHCIEKRKQILDYDHPDTLTSMSGLASLYSDMGQFDKSHPLFEQCLEKRKHVLGFNHPRTLDSMNYLGIVYKNMGHYDKAEFILQQCLEMQIQALGADHPDVLGSMNSLALLYKSMGQYERSKGLLEQCLEKTRRILGNDHPDTFTSMSNLGVVYEAMGHNDKAGPLYELCLDKCQQTLGHDHPQTIVLSTNLANLYSSMGQYEKAESMYKQCLEKSQQILGHDHQQSITLHFFIRIWVSMKKLNHC